LATRTPVLRSALPLRPWSLALLGSCTSSAHHVGAAKRSLEERSKAWTGGGEGRWAAPGRDRRRQSRPANGCPASADPVALQLVVQRALADAEPLRGAAAVAADLLERAADRGLLELGDRAAVHGRRRGGRGGAHDDLVAADHVAIGKDRGALERVGQLAHVAV